MSASRRSSSMAPVPNMGYASPEGSPEVFQGVRGGLAEDQVVCNGVAILSLCVVHEGENVLQ